MKCLVYWWLLPTLKLCLFVYFVCHNTDEKYNTKRILNRES